EIIAGWKLGRLPERFNPAAAGDPFVALRLRDALLDLREKIFAGVCALEIQSHLALTDSENVAMRISQTGQNGFACEINNVRFVAPEFFGIRICSNENNAIAMDCDCFGVSLLFVNGVDVSVNENSIGRFRVGGNAAHEKQDSNDSAHHGTLFCHSERKRQSSPSCRPLRAGSGSDRNFFLPSGGVFIESAHTVLAARATLTI